MFCVSVWMSGTVWSSTHAQTHIVTLVVFFVSAVSLFEDMNKWPSSPELLRDSIHQHFICCVSFRKGAPYVIEFASFQNSNHYVLKKDRNYNTLRLMRNNSQFYNSYFYEMRQPWWCMWPTNVTVTRLCSSNPKNEMTLSLTVLVVL